MIRAVLIDVDNTLLDFDLCTAEAIRAGFLSLGLPDREDALPVFHAINDALWLRFERGEITREQIYAVRWNLTLERLGIAADGADLERRYSAGLRSSHIPVEGALELLQYLSKCYTLYVASNSSYEHQLQRLTLAGMTPYISDIFTSCEVGFSKPDARFFQHCLGKIGLPREEVFLIGDSVTADVRGGLAAGIATCWYNHRREPLPPPELTPDHIVNRLSDIQTIL